MYWFNSKASLKLDQFKTALANEFTTFMPEIITTGIESVEKAKKHKHCFRIYTEGSFMKDLDKLIEKDGGLFGWIIVNICENDDFVIRNSYLSLLQIFF